MPTGSGPRKPDSNTHNYAPAPEPKARRTTRRSQFLPLPFPTPPFILHRPVSGRWQFTPPIELSQRSLQLLQPLLLAITHTLLIATSNILVSRLLRQKAEVDFRSSLLCSGDDGLHSSANGLHDLR